MSIFDWLVLAIALLVLETARTPLYLTLFVAVIVIILVRVIRGERL